MDSTEAHIVYDQPWVAATGLTLSVYVGAYLISLAANRPGYVLLRSQLSGSCL